jgi:hypothetical protein
LNALDTLNTLRTGVALRARITLLALNALDTTQVQALAATQVAALTTTQIASLQTTDIASYGALAFLLTNAGEEVLNPLDVDGWPEDLGWISDDTLVQRLNMLDRLFEFAVAPTAPFQRLAPYSGLVVGPLPGFPPLTERPIALPDPTPTPLPLPSPDPEPPVEIEAARPVETTGAIVAPAAPEPLTLTLTPSPEREPEAGRTVWEDAARPAAEHVDQAPLFQDAPPAVSILRHEAEPETPRRFDWSETGMYLIMGGLGLVSCAVSAAAFRVAVEDPSPMGETTAVAWTLAVIGAVCVGAASWHLYVRTMRRKG